jgi:hypothetical protein
MSLTLAYPNNNKYLQQQPYYLKFDTTTASFIPYTNIADANAVIPSASRGVGMFVNVANVLHWYKDGTADINLIPFALSGGSGWGLTGNAGTNPSTNFIGTTDDVDFVIGRNNSQIARFYSDRLFIGINAGLSTTSAVHSNFLGPGAGLTATNARNSNFIGQEAGYEAASARNSNFIGTYAGYRATNASYSNFIGNTTGTNATNASYSNFTGFTTGQGATNANNSNFIGTSAGIEATNASYSNFIGYYAGSSFPGNNVGSNNIIIGTNISLPDATANAINLGGVLFGTGTYSTITGIRSIVPTSTGRIGIGVVTPATCSLLDLTSTDKGLLLPRMTKAERDLISTPIAGLAVYQTDNTPGLRVYNGTSWMKYTETTD